MAGKIKAILRLLRVQQYYKNVILFVGVFFGGKMFSFHLYPLLILAFILVSLMSSLNYIHNDILDIEKDKIHPEKQKSRPLASGALTKAQAWLIFALIAALEIFFIIYFWNMFSLLLIAIYINGLVYNFFFKNHAFSDVIALSMIYVWRSLAGCVIINILISPWLVVMMFLIAMFLAICKRIADLTLLGEENASKHKKIYDYYSAQLLQSMQTMIATMLLIVYALYCVLGPRAPGSIVPENNQGLLIFSLPIAFYLVIRFMYLTHEKPQIARKTELLITDRGMVIGALLLAVIVVIILYIEIGTFTFLSPAK
jgi:4-hydroxybenzoate polyprenyltransferase